MLISLNNLSFGYNDVKILQDINFTLSENERVGFIGANGEGKTTLIKLILGELEADSGKIILKNGIRIGYLAQNGGYDSENTVWEEMKEIFSQDIKNMETLRILEEKISLEHDDQDSFRILSAKYEALNKQIAARDSYHYEVKIRSVLSGMGFDTMYDQKICTMSGGEKTRLKLCRLLLEEPEVLILDEPTNHLDITTLFWLEEYLSSYKGAIFTVSHDRYFLDKLVNKIIELEQKHLYEYKGNYSKYKQLKAEKLQLQEKEYKKQQEEIAHMQDYVDRNLTRASTTKMAQSRRTALEKMEKIDKPLSAPTPPKFQFNFTENPYEKVLDIENLSLTAGDKTLLKNVDFHLRRGEKCAIMGENGTGKSTLLHTMIEGTNPAIHWGRFVKIAFYDQENANLNTENTVLQELWERHSLWTQTQVRSILAQVKLQAEDMDKKVKQLSGGERAKLALAVFSCEKGNVLLLDEPTNHLDLAARESLEEALKKFEGTVLFVSHDRYFINALSDKIAELKNQTLTEFKGTYDEYTDFCHKKEAPVMVEKSKPIQKENNYKNKAERSAEAKKRDQIKSLEKNITLLEEEENKINQEIALPEICGDYNLLKEKCDRLSCIHTQLEKLYNEYELIIE